MKRLITGLCFVVVGAAQQPVTPLTSFSQTFLTKESSNTALAFLGAPQQVTGYSALPNLNPNTGAGLVTVEFSGAPDLVYRAEDTDPGYGWPLVATNATSGKFWVARPQALDVRWFGAVAGDGVKDDDAIEAAIESPYQANVPIVLDGAFEVESLSILEPCTILGGSLTSSLVAYSPTKMIVTAASNVVFRGVTIDANNKHAIVVYSGGNANLFDKCVFKSATCPITTATNTYLLYVIGDHTSVTGCDFSDVSNDNVATYASRCIGFAGADGRVMYSTFHDMIDPSDGDAVQFQSDAGQQGGLISDCHFTNVIKSAIKVQQKGVVLRNVRIESGPYDAVNTQVAAVRLLSSDVVVNGLTITGGYYNNALALDMSSSDAGSDILISDVTIHTDSTTNAASRYAIYAYQAVGGCITNLVLRNFSVVGPWNNAVYLVGPWNGVTIDTGYIEGTVAAGMTIANVSTSYPTNVVVNNVAFNHIGSAPSIATLGPEAYRIVGCVNYQGDIVHYTSAGQPVLGFNVEELTKATPQSWSMYGTLHSIYGGFSGTETTAPVTGANLAGLYVKEATGRAGHATWWVKRESGLDAEATLGHRSVLTTARTSLADTTLLVDPASTTGLFEANWTAVGGCATNAPGATITGTGTLTSSSVAALVGPARYVTVTLVASSSTITGNASISVYIGGNVLKTYTSGVLPTGGNLVFSGAVTGTDGTMVFTSAVGSGTLNVVFDSVQIKTLSTADFFHRHSMTAAWCIPHSSISPYLTFQASGSFANSNAKNLIVAIAGTPATSTPYVLRTIPLTNVGPWRLVGNMYANTASTYLLDSQLIADNTVTNYNVASTTFTGSSNYWSSGAYLYIGADADVADSDVTINSSLVEFKP